MKVDLVICRPGNPSSLEQSLNVDNVIASLRHANLKVGIRGAKSCNIYRVRNGCLSLGGTERNQKPFEGIYDDYQKMIWIDSDNIVTIGMVAKLLKHDVDIVAGAYKQSAVAGLSYGFLDKHNNAKKSEQKDFFLNEKGLIDVDYSGFGLMVIKKGVFESLGYPWFRSWVNEWTENGVNYSDIMTDDVGFSIRAREKGFHIYVDPTVISPHEKMNAI